MSINNIMMAAAGVSGVTPLPTDPYFDNVVLLLTGDYLSNGSTSVEDNSYYKHQLIGTASIDNTVSKFITGGSINFNGNSYLNVPKANDFSTEFTIGSSDFTFETWVNLTSHGVTGTYLYLSLPVNVGTIGVYPYFGFYNGNFAMGTYGNTPFAVGTSTVATGEFVHVAASRKDGILRLFVNGVKEYEAADSNIYDPVGSVNIFSGFPYDTNWNGVGYIDDMRMTVSTARYIADFAKPTDKSPVNAIVSTGVTWKTPTLALPATYNWVDSKYANGKWVIIARDTNYGVYSTDSKTWNLMTLPANTSWKKLSYGNGKFVAISTNNIDAANSTDGINWVSASLPFSAGWNSVEYGNNTFIAVDLGTNSAISSDGGVTWSNNTLPITQIATGSFGTTSSEMTDATVYGNGIYLKSSYLRGNLERSTDGLYWTYVSMPVSSSSWKIGCYGSGKFIAFTNNGSNYGAYSTDGLAWSSSTLPSGYTWNVISYNPLAASIKFVGIGTYINTATYSTDGINWVSSAGFPIFYSSQVIPVSSSYFMAVGGNGSTSSILAYGSGTGSNWAQFTLPTMPYIPTWSSAASSGSNLVMVDNSGSGVLNAALRSASTSPTSTWTIITLPITGSWNSIAYGASKYVMVGNGVALRSTDTLGTTWAQSSIPAGNWYNITHDGTQFIANSGNSYPVFSTDGVAWSSTKVVTPKWGSITFGNNKFVTVANGGRGIAVSTDSGVSWSINTNVPLGKWGFVSYGSGNYVCKDSNNTSVIVSTDTITWTLDTNSGAISETSNLIYDGNKFLELGGGNAQSNKVGYSKDGISWVTSSLPTQYWNGVLSSDGKKAIVNRNGDGTNYRLSYNTNPIAFGYRASQGIASIAYGNGRYVQIAGNATAQYTHSTDALSWVYGSLPVSSTWTGVVYSMNKFVAVGSGYSAATSTDGLNWTKRTMPYSQSWSAIASNGISYVASGPSLVVGYSTDGLVWTANTVLMSGTLAPTSWSNVCAAGARYIIPTTTGDSFVVGDGVSWFTSVTPTTGTALGISVAGASDAFGKKAIFPVGTQQVGVIDSTGAWTVYTLPFSGVKKVAWGPAGFVVNGSTGTGATSTDGVNWTYLDIPGSSQNMYSAGGVYLSTTAISKSINYADLSSTKPRTSNLITSTYGVKYINGRYCVNTSQGLTTSTDSVNWTTSSTTSNFYSISYGNGKYVSGLNSNTRAIATSTDTISWTFNTLALTGTRKNIEFGNGVFVSIRDGAVVSEVSTDGLSWTRSSTILGSASINNSSSGCSSIAYGSGVYVAIYGIDSSSDAVSVSTDSINWITTGLPTTSNWSSIRYGAGRFVAVGSTSANNYATSTDGYAWTTGTLPVSTSYYGVEYGSGKFVAMNNGGVSTPYSTDGINWSTVANTITSTNNNCVATNGTWFYSVGSGITASYSSTGTSWTATSLPVSATWSGIAINPTSGRIVAITNGTDAAYASVGSATFTRTTIPGTAGWTGVAYGNNIFVAVKSGVGHVAKSTDGITWTVNTLSTGSGFKSISYNASVGFVAVGASNVGSSTDGINWTVSTLAIKAPSAWSMVYNNSKFVATSVSTNTASSAVSTDGFTWTNGSMPSIANWVVTAGPDKFVACDQATNSKKTAYSTDGINWTATTTPLAINVAATDIAYGNGKYLVTTATTQKMKASTDGINWTIATIPLYHYPNGDTIKMCYGGSGFMLTSAYTNKVSITTDGYNWGYINQTSTSATAMHLETMSASASASWSAMAYGKGTFVAVAPATQIVQRSFNGVYWQSNTLPVSASWSGVSYGNGIFVAVADTNVTAWSLDGRLWNGAGLPASGTWKSIEFGNGAFVAVGSSNIIGKTIDGISWTASSVPVSFNWSGIAYGNGVYAITSTAGIGAASSADGITWTQSSLPSSANWNAVTFGNGIFVTVDNTASSRKSAYSMNGFDWTASTLPVAAAWSNVKYSNGKFVAISTGGIASAVSTDGVNWTSSSLNTSTTWLAEAYGLGNFVALNATSTSNIASG